MILNLRKIVSGFLPAQALVSRRNRFLQKSEQHIFLQVEWLLARKIWAPLPE
ncbi:hypothetical protein SPV1_06214 [Mariprofundus ferrooxydans PV-1]|uniref:Uncharacterized protein n=1 Tax=Mariprofundus ferrooxydans PV-1 TaxID=314345 RepID=Q0EWS8_9PROT|nr:hypothetical protein SPV1_06214 [Mariprofundus ferrooxydans PV-1]